VKDPALVAVVADVEGDAPAVDVVVEALLTVTSESSVVVPLDMAVVSVALQLLHMAEASVDLLLKLHMEVLLMAVGMAAAVTATPVDQEVSLHGGNLFQANGVFRFSSTFVNSIEIWASLDMKFLRRFHLVYSTFRFFLRHDNSLLCF